MRIKGLNKYVWPIGLIVLLVTIIAAGIGCSSSKSSTNSSGGTSTQPLTISGVLQQGSVAVNLSSYDVGISKGGGVFVNNSQLSGLSAMPLTGYSLYCVTFSSPTVAGSGTADASGNIAVTFNATSTPFGCFVLDSNNNVVATVIFSDPSSSQSSQTVSFSGDADLGTITVDITNGVAQVTLPSTGTIVSTTPAGAPCPIGTWTGSAGPSPCSSGDVPMISLIAQKPSGEYIVSFSVSHVMITINGSDTCGTFSDNIPATYSGGTLKYSFNGDPGCSSKVHTVTATFDSACKTMNLNISTVGCSSCSGGCSGCGVSTCTETYTAARQ